MRRGEIWLVDLEPVLGAEASKRRPAVVVANDGAAQAAERLGRGVVSVVPLTTSTDSVYSFQVLVPALVSGLDQDSKAQAEQVRSVDVRRFVRPLGRLAPDLLGAVDDALRLHLAL